MNHLSPLYPPHGRIRIAEAQRGDFDEVADLFGALHAHNAELDELFSLAENWRELLYDHFVRTVGTPSVLWLLAWDGPRAVGLLLMEQHLDSPLFRYRRWAELVAIYVVPEQRGSGLAQRFLEEAYRWAAARNLDRIQLYVTTSNERAKAFYANAGFRPVQEIWRIAVTPVADAASLPDPPRTTDRGSVDFVQLGHHHLGMDDHD
ncbi:MAG: GNAT family N-acetyltransferase [Chloroflexota bacterium]|nr:GNAT family N-acetyltransferase [Dehalococcoidia bacterium]MDW8255084.1 GNAT family N-acetyltransferase [Chloroflexota bacterium]